MTRGYAENGWNVVKSLGYIPPKKTINVISSPLIYFASSFQSEIVFFYYEIMALHPLKAYAENCISLLLFGLTQVMNSGVRASCSNNKESDNEIWNFG